jgi:hypothetical protein
VRNGVGLIDVGTLGKLEVIGPQAAEFLERVYTSNYANLKVGMTRYAVMCDESGVVIDDGVVARLADDHFYFTTTTSGAATIYRELSRLNTMWRLDCGIVNHTGAFAAVNLAGPKSREVLKTHQPGPLRRRLPLPGGARGRGGWHPGPADARRLRGRVGLRDPRARQHGRRPVGRPDAGRQGPRHPPLRRRSPAPAAPREGPHHHQPGHRRPHHPAGGGHGLGGEDGQALLRRPAQPRRHRPQAAQAAAGRHRLPGGLQRRRAPGMQPGHRRRRHRRPRHQHRLQPQPRRHIGLAFLRPDLAETGTTVSIRLTDGTLVQAQVSTTPFYDPDNLKQKEAA